MRILMLMAAVLAAACAPMTPAGPRPVDVAVVKPVPPASEALCKTEGGNWQPICMMQKPACVLTFADAGKGCTDSSQCSGQCVAAGSLEPDKPAVGVCTQTSDPCGCKQFVEDGKASWPLCAD